MSLQVWLPLTKDLRQQGLSNVTVTNNGATYESSGKLGGCYNLTNGPINITNLPNPTSISVAFWFKRTANTNTRQFMFTAWSGVTCELTTDGKPTFAVYRNSYPTITGPTAITTSTGWIHYCGTFSPIEGMKMYLNGELVASNTNTTAISWSTTTGQIGKYGSYASMSAQMDDFRLYDHALSQMEVKELAKGLILHYPLNRQGWGQENLLKNTNFDSNFISSLVVNNGINLDQWRNENANVSLSMDGQYVKLHYEASTSRYGIHYEIALEPGTYTYSITAGGRMTCTFGPATNWPSANNITTNIPGRYSATFTVTEAATWRMYIYTTSANPDIWFNWPKLEIGEIATPWCPNSSDVLATTMGLNSTTEYDCSGFCNNGTRTGTFTWTSNTSKYAVSQVFNGTDNAIQTPNLTTMITDKNYTIACWTYKTVIGTKNYQTIYGGPGGFELEARSGSSTSPLYRIHNWGGGTTAYNFGEWTHFCFVHTDSDSKLYVNGELKITGTSVDIPSGNYFVGAWNTSISQNYEGNMSDFRIYATALSADDVKSLYQNSAYIDSSGNVYGAVHTEV